VLCPKTATNTTKEFICSTKRISEGYLHRGSQLITYCSSLEVQNGQETLAFFYFKKERENKNLGIQLLVLSTGFVMPSHHKPIYRWLLKHWWVNTGEKNALRKSEFIYNILAMWMT